jgi:hypothetical protein
MIMKKESAHAIYSGLIILFIMIVIFVCNRHVIRRLEPTQDSTIVNKATYFTYNAKERRKSFLLHPNFDRNPFVSAKTNTHD